MKKVLVFENSGKCRFGGGQKMSLNIAKILNEEFTLAFADFAKNSVYRDKIHSLFPDAPFITMKGYSSRNRIKLFAWMIEVFLSLLYSISNLRNIVSIIGKKDVITYATDKKTLIYAYLLKVIYGIPFILHAHLVENPSRLYYPLYIMMAKKAQKVICCSRTVVNSVKIDNTLLLYNPNFNYDGQKKYSQNKHPFVVAVAGSLITIKGFEYFVKAAKYLDSGIELRVYGSGPLEKELKKLANNKVRFMGFCNNIVGELYADVDVVAVVTIIQEANSLSVLEAKSVGLPVIVTNIGGQAELVEDGKDGILVPIKDAKAIANAINSIYRDKDKYIDMANASFASVEKYDLKRYKDRIVKLFLSEANS